MPLDEPAWTFEYTIDCGVTAEFAWNFWTPVSNWKLDADVDSIEIDRPLAAGARGVTNSKSSGRIEWRIADAHAGKASIEFPLPGAVGRLTGHLKKPFKVPESRSAAPWRASRPLPTRRHSAPLWRVSFRGGMQKLCSAMESAAQTRSRR
jgi:hypothetical protein